MNSGGGIRAIGLSRHAINYVFRMKSLAKDRVFEARHSTPHVGRNRATISDYALRLRAVANDTVLEVRDSASHVDWKRAHDELLRLAKERAGLDWHEGRSLLSALRSFRALRPLAERSASSTNRSQSAAVSGCRNSPRSLRSGRAPLRARRSGRCSLLRLRRGSAGRRFGDRR